MKADFETMVCDTCGTELGKASNLEKAQNALRSHKKSLSEQFRTEVEGAEMHRILQGRVARRIPVYTLVGHGNLLTKWQFEKIKEQAHE